jgi:UDP-glucose 4-epimerase
LRRILVTGAAGFIGSHVTERFLAEGWNVVALDDLSTGHRENLPPEIELAVLDVNSVEAADLVKTGFDLIVHLAAQMDVRHSVADPLFDAHVNIRGTINLLEAARHSGLPLPRFIFTSTGGALYGSGAALPTAEDWTPNPDSPYGTSKLSVENYLSYYNRIWGLDQAVLRFGNVFGPRQSPHGEAGVIAIFAGQMLAGRPVTVFGTGSQSRDYVYVSDIVDAVYLMAMHPFPHSGTIAARAYNIGTEVETSVSELIEKIQRIGGRKIDVRHAPERPGEVSRSVLSAGKAERELGWSAKVSLDEGLARTLEWLQL